MALAARRSSRILLVAAIIALLLFLHVLYNGSSIPQWKTPGFAASAWSKSDHSTEERPGGRPLGVYSEPAPLATSSPKFEFDFDAHYEVSATTSVATWSTSTRTASTKPTSASGLKTAPAVVPYPTQFASTNPIGETANQTSSRPAYEAPAPCRSLPGAEDILVVMRTGATEIRDKLTMHINSTFKCYPNLVIFSDYEEIFEGFQVHDVLKYMDEEIKTSNSDFAHYRHIQTVGRTGLDQSELSGELSFESGPLGKNDNAGWRLDKWKFLPMANQTLALYPDMKWYVFVEPDTYLVWSNLLRWIPLLDPSESLYFGSEVMIGDDLFAHGGSAFLMSKPALESGARIYQEQTKEWDSFTANHWAGDCVLGKALHDAGTNLTWTWPMFQGGNPALMNFMENKGGDANRLWCSPAISYHHFNPIEIQELFDFEQQWIQNQTLNATPAPSSKQQQQPLIHHSDVFTSYIKPNLTMERSDWNNTSIAVAPNTLGFTISECRALCESQKTCMQYAADVAGCYLDEEAKLGRREKGVESGWIVSRVEKWMKSRNQCEGKTGWTKPDQ